MAEESVKNEERLTVSYSLPLSVVRAIEYYAFLHRLNKSEALAQLIRMTEVTAPEREAVTA